MEMQKDSSSARVLSIDALRGFDMFWIIGGGAIFESLVHVWKHPITETLATQLTHVVWEGFRFEDLIFPLFVFLVGAVLPFSIVRRKEQGHNTVQLHWHVVRRAATLFVLGLIYNGLLEFDWPDVRIPGVLQRIALCYLFAGLIVLNTRWRTQAVIVAVVLLAYWAVTMLVPVPGGQAGDLTMEGCLSSYVDQQVIPGELYYKYGDNEGVISTFPAVCTALLGALAGQWLRSNRTGEAKAQGLRIAGVVFVIIGWLWGREFPIIKILWTSSYVLVAAGWSLLLLALFYWIIDVKGYRKWSFPFVVIGVNAITIYFLQSFVNFEEISRFFLGGLARHYSHLAPLIIPAGAFAASWLLLWFLYRHKIFFKV